MVVRYVKLFTTQYSIMSRRLLLPTTSLLYLQYAIQALYPLPNFEDRSAYSLSISPVGEKGILVIFFRNCIWLSSCIRVGFRISLYTVSKYNIFIARENRRQCIQPPSFRKMNNNIRIKNYFSLLHWK